MHTRRDFLRNAGLLAAASGTFGGFSDAIRKAMAIAPTPGTSFLDAEHVVILMQENRSFDHCFGSLRGVRGFNDPRALRLASGDPVWVQSDGAGRKFAPYRTDMKATNVTWTGSLPHGWADQTDAANGGLHDRWLDSKPTGNPDCKGMPLTLSYYTRDDIPFYYELADAFTICDQNFCSSLTGTTPNRLYLWTGTVRPTLSADSFANVRNEEVIYDHEVSWTTFAERLELAGISWKVYQNEISIKSGLTGESDAWLACFEDNPLEWFTQFKVRFAPRRREFVAARITALEGDLAKLRAGGEAGAIQAAEAELKSLREEQKAYTVEGWEALTQEQRRLHERAFCDNRADPDYRKLTKLEYDSNGQRRSVDVPAGDVLHQFRRDVESGELPAVSWLVPPERFSDHPCSPWYGAWYLSEVMSILTKNPEVWKKTIFVLTYDENDGYFDHVPPFAPPAPGAGIASEGLRPELDRHRLEDDLKRRPAAEARGGPIGLGFRVPMIVASPWSRGGRVCSQVFDHTSVLQLIERLFSRKAGQSLEESNITPWRRAVCGDLTSVFSDPDPAATVNLTSEGRDGFIRGLYEAKFKPLPGGFKEISAADAEKARSSPRECAFLPRQEPGVRESCALPYELSVNADVTDGGIGIAFAAGNVRFGRRSAGTAFIAYERVGPGEVRVRNYAVGPGAVVRDLFKAGAAADGPYVEVFGPNGFYREFAGVERAHRAGVSIACRDGADGSLDVTIRNAASGVARVRFSDQAYGAGEREVEVVAGATQSISWSTTAGRGWYDCRAVVDDVEGAAWRFAGRVETGRNGVSDPAMA
ncbi:MAG: phosphocholine-specific phospholipase C [Phycisphaerales bacterium]